MSKPLSDLIGTHTKRLRHLAGATQEEVATAGRALGLGWSLSSISAVEGGNFRATVETVTALQLVLSSLLPDRPRGVALADLLGFDAQDPRTDSLVQLTPRLQTTVSDLLRLWSGQLPPADFLDHSQTAEAWTSWTADGPPDDASPQAWSRFAKSVQADPISSAEERLARKIDLTGPEIRQRALRLWGHSVIQERDARAGVDASSQARGQVSRVLLQQLQEES